MTDLHDKLTALLTAHPAVAERLLFACQRELSYAQRGGFRPEQEDRIAADILDEIPTDYFSSALARVAEAVESSIAIMYWDSHGGKQDPSWSAVVSQGFDNNAGDGATLRAALIALWLAILTAVCEKCERCEGDGYDIEVRNYEYEYVMEEHGCDIPVGTVIRDQQQEQVQVQCASCNGTGYKTPDAPKILDALVGSAGSPQVGEE